MRFRSALFLGKSDFVYLHYYYTKPVQGRFEAWEARGPLGQKDHDSRWVEYYFF